MTSGTADLPEVFELTAPSHDDDLRDRAVASVVGGAAADSMGWITEFMKSHQSLRKLAGVDWLDSYVSWPKRTGGRFNTYVDHINAGDYSDDTQLSLCVARSIEPDGTFNSQYFMKVELPLWAQYARGAGSTITGAAKAAERRSADWNSNFFRYKRRSKAIDYRDSGANGVAMRVGPLAVANVQQPEELQLQVWRCGVTTHGHPRALLGALLIAEAHRRVLAQQSLSSQVFLPSLAEHVSQLRLPEHDGFGSWRDRWNEDGRDFDAEFDQTKIEAQRALETVQESRTQPIEDVLRSLGCYAPETRGSGLGTAAAAIALFYRYGGNYKACVEQAVNAIGTDTDTIAAMAGSLAGAHGGMDAIPEGWAVKVQDFWYLSRVAEALTRVSLRQADEWELGPLTAERVRVPAGVDLSGATQFHKGQRISHPIFGLGWIRNVQSQETRRRGAALLVLVDVEFDMGQSIRLKRRPELLKAAEEQVLVKRERHTSRPATTAAPAERAAGLLL